MPLSTSAVPAATGSRNRSNFRSPPWHHGSSIGVSPTQARFRQRIQVLRNKSARPRGCFALYQGGNSEARSPTERGTGPARETTTAQRYGSIGDMGTDNDIHGEEAIIQEFLAPLAAAYPGAFGLKDDCAVITPSPGHELVVKTDPVAEGVHFLIDDPPEDIGWKSLAVNVSDLAAKAAIPRAYLMALSFPEAPTRAWMQRFAQGLREAQTVFGMHLIGGDTDRRPGPMTVSITVFGEAPTDKMVRRATATAGDIICVSGSLGDAALGLRLLQDPALAARLRLDAPEATCLISRYRRPRPALVLRDALRQHARAAMDLSDGLAKDLGRMCRTSGVGARVEAMAIPVSPAARNAFDADPNLFPVCISAGDDYEVLCAVPPGELEPMQHHAAAAGCQVHAIGAFVAGTDVAIWNRDGTRMELPSRGWDHF